MDEQRKGAAALPPRTGQAACCPCQERHKQRDLRRFSACASKDHVRLPLLTRLVSSRQAMSAANQSRYRFEKRRWMPVQARRMRVKKRKRRGRSLWSATMTAQMSAAASWKSWIIGPEIRIRCDDLIPVCLHRLSRNPQSTFPADASGGSHIASTQAGYWRFVLRFVRPACNFESKED